MHGETMKYQTYFFECDVYQDVHGQENIVHTVDCIPHANMQKITRYLDILQTRVRKTLHAEGMQQVQHLHPGHFVLRLGIFSPMAIASYTVTSC